MSQDAVQVFTGDCTIRFEGDHKREERGAVLVLAKPDNTVLVHDRSGYRPVAWLTRAESVTWNRDNGGFELEATAEDKRLQIECHDEHTTAAYQASRAGRPVGTCPSCTGTLVHARSTVSCLRCTDEYRVPRDATITGAAGDICTVCDLPLMRAERGRPFEVCVDRQCESLDDRVRERYDRAWTCPECGDDLLVLRRGGLLAGCGSYPDCDTAFAIPTGTITGSCTACDLPVFDTPAGRRCLDATCTTHPAP